MSETPSPATTSNFADLTGLRCVVTGASSGIGRAIALELARGGGDIVVHYGRSRQSAEKVATEIRQSGRRCELLQGDLLQLDPQALVDSAWNLLGGVDVWVNNAGADLLTGAARQLSYGEKLDLLWQVDVRGTVNLSRLAATKMQEAGGGVILNIGWDQADRGMGGESGELFSTAKNAIMGFTRSLAVSFAPQVRVNAIAPGWIQTAWGLQASDQWQQRVLAETPLARWGQPEDIARLARFLVSREAAYLTGQVINANGGAER